VRCTAAAAAAARGWWGVCLCDCRLTLASDMTVYVNSLLVDAFCHICHACG
jgi:hypothetical protein